MNMDVILVILGGVNGIAAIFFQLRSEYDKATYYMVVAFGCLLGANNR